MQKICIVQDFPVATLTEPLAIASPDKGLLIAESPKVMPCSIGIFDMNLWPVCASKNTSPVILPPSISSQVLAATLLYMRRGLGGEKRLTGYVLTRGVLCAMRPPCAPHGGRHSIRMPAPSWSSTVWWTPRTLVPIFVRRPPWDGCRVANP